MFDRGKLACDFRRLGVKAGDTVMLNASVRAVGKIVGGPDQIHLGLLDAISPGGTVMMYASCPRYYDEVGRGNLTPEEEQEVLEKLPAFDPLLDRAAQENGVLVEFFRTYPGTVPSAQVARMAARGERAVYPTADQPFEYPLGVRSPCEKLLELGGKIDLGRTPLAGDEGSRQQWRHANWPEDLFERILSGFLSATRNQGGRVADAQTYVLDAQHLLAYAGPIMEAMATGQ